MELSELSRQLMSSLGNSFHLFVSFAIPKNSHRWYLCLFVFVYAVLCLFVCLFVCLFMSFFANFTYHGSLLVNFQVFYQILISSYRALHDQFITQEKHHNDGCHKAGSDHPSDYNLWVWFEVIAYIWFLFIYLSWTQGIAQRIIPLPVTQAARVQTWTLPKIFSAPNRLGTPALCSLSLPMAWSDPANRWLVTCKREESQ